MSGEHIDPNVGVLTQRVSSLEQGFSAVLTKLDALGNQIADRSRTPWGTLAAIAGTGVAVIGAISGLAFKPLADGQAKLEAAFVAMSTKIESDERGMRDALVGKGEFVTIMQAVKDRRDDAQRVSEERFKRIEADADNTQKQVVSRGELDEKFAAIRSHDQDVQRQLDEIRSRGEALYGPRDELTRLSREVEDLRGRVARPAP